MFLPDPSRALVEFRRVVRPNGRIAVTVLGTAEQVPIWGALAAALAERLPEQRVDLYRSFSLADPIVLNGVFTAAGFRDVSISEERRTATFATFADYWEPIEAGVGMLPHAYAALTGPDRRRVRHDVERRLRQHNSADRVGTRHRRQPRRCTPLSPLPSTGLGTTTANCIVDPLTSPSPEDGSLLRAFPGKVGLANLVWLSGGASSRVWAWSTGPRDSATAPADRRRAILFGSWPVRLLL